MQKPEPDTHWPDTAHGERQKAAPLGLRRRIETRVRFIALQDRERRRFRGALLGGVVSAVAVTVSALVALWEADLPARLSAQAPGSQGQLDRFVSLAWGSGIELAALGAFVVSALLALTILWTHLSLSGIRNTERGG